MSRTGMFGLALLLVLVPLVSEGEVYRCRDRSGTMLMTDDPSKFPPGCQPVADSAEEEGAFTVIETPARSSAGANGVEQAVRHQRAETSQRQDQIEAWKAQAQELARTYQAAVDRRNQAYNSWSYDSREVVKESLEQMEAVKKKKTQLLQEVTRVFIPAPDREIIREALATIP